jgi:hypothetical protein
MKVKVAVPSYHRAGLMRTTKYLPFAQVYVDPAEVQDYRDQNPGIEIVPCPEGVQGNLSRVNNYIMQAGWDEGADVVLILDDDIEGLYYWEAKRKKRVETADFLWFVTKYSLLAQEWGSFMWGVNLSQDKQTYREYTPFSTLCMVAGGFQCFLRGNECWYDEELFLKEDYDIVLQELHRYRKVVRLNRYFLNVHISTLEGGNSTMRNWDHELMLLKRLQAKWGRRLIRTDHNDRSHNIRKRKTRPDFVGVLKVPIRGV